MFHPNLPVSVADLSPDAGRRSCLQHYAGLANRPQLTAGLANRSRLTAGLANRPRLTTGLANRPRLATGLANRSRLTAGLANRPRLTAGLANRPRLTAGLVNRACLVCSANLGGKWQSKAAEPRLRRSGGGSEIFITRAKQQHRSSFRGWLFTSSAAGG